MNVIKLVSGGIDSYIMSQQFEGKNVYIDFGQKYAEQEKTALDKLGVEYDVIKFECGFKNNDIYINNRNLCLASIVAMTYSPDKIYIAGLKDDNCIDKTEFEFKVMSDTISRYCTKSIAIESPYWHKTKADIIQEFKEKEKLIDTFSCYNPKKDRACGDCPACLRRVIALETCGVNTGVELSDRIINEYISKIHNYDSDRMSRFFIYLSKRKKITAIDIDGVLCEEKNVPYENRNAIKENIEKINDTQGYKILYTARLEQDRKTTVDWLLKNNVKYDALIMNKLPYNKLIDDRSVASV